MPPSRCLSPFCFSFFPLSRRDTCASGGASTQVTYPPRTAEKQQRHREIKTGILSIREPGVRRLRPSTAHLAGDSEEDALEHRPPPGGRIRSGQRQRGETSLLPSKYFMFIKTVKKPVIRVFYAFCAFCFSCFLWFSFFMFFVFLCFLCFLMFFHVFRVFCIYFFVCFLCYSRQESGLSRWIGAQMAPLHAIPPWAIAVILCLLIATFTECASNVATATLFLPILASMVTIA